MLGRIISASLLLVALSAQARADIWDPNCVEVQPWDDLNGAVVSPHSGTPLTASVISILIRDPFVCQPMANAQVVVLLTSANPVCPGAVLNATTDSQGRCTMTIAAGGCSDGQPSVCVIKANGVTMRAYINAKSPDFDGARGDGVVNLADLIVFAREFNGQDPAGCHDYTNDNLCNLSDLTIFGEAFSRALHCQ